MRYLDVCAGISAATVAWAPLGYHAVAFSEIDPFACAVLKHHYPHIPNWGDMTRFKDWPDANLDVLVGGTPCQSYSIAGLREGLDDPRGQLLLVYLAIAQRYRPKWLVWENVPGVLSAGDGRAFGTLLRGLEELGYGFCWRSLDAQYFRLAQRRKRVFLVGHLGDWRRAAAVLLEPEGMRWDPAPRRKAREDIATTIAGGSRERGGYSHDDIPVATIDASYGRLRGQSDQDANHGHSTLVAFGGNDTRGPRETAAALRAHGSQHGDFESETFLVHAPDTSKALRASDGGIDREDGHTILAFDCKRGSEAGEISPTLRAMGHNTSHNNGGGQVAVAFAQNQRDEVRLMDVAGSLAAEPRAKQQTYVAQAFESRYARNGRGAPSDVVPTLKAQSGETGKGDGAPLLLHGMTVRRLTPLECERLQGLPDYYTLIPYRGKLATDSPRYKSIGNSIARPVLQWIGRRIQIVDSL